MFFAFSTDVNAQDNKLEDPRVLAKQEISSLLKIIELDNEIVIGLVDLLTYKHSALAKSPESKEEIAKTMQDKLKGTLTTEQFEKVKSNKTLFEDLIY